MLCNYQYVRALQSGLVQYHMVERQKQTGSRRSRQSAFDFPICSTPGHLHSIALCAALNMTIDSADHMHRLSCHTLREPSQELHVSLYRTSDDKGSDPESARCKKTGQSLPAPEAQGCSVGSPGLLIRLVLQVQSASHLMKLATLRATAPQQQTLHPCGLLYFSHLPFDDPAISGRPGTFI